MAVNLGLCVVLICCQKGLAEESGLQRYSRIEPHMGTRFEIIAYCESKSKCNAAMDDAFSIIARLDATLSNYLSDSELNQFCQGSPHATPVPISRPMLEVLLRSRQISEQTDGAFDITIGPLTKLWRRARRQKRLPSEQRLAETMRSVGFQNLKVNAADRTAQLTLPNMKLDMGGIAKGYAIDEALAAMKRHGIAQSLVNGGGDVAVGKAPPNRDHWRVQVFDGTKDNAMVLRLVEQAVATSGDLYQFVEVDGKRYSHLVNPRTGIGLTSFISSTVIAPDATTADGWASALALVGSEKGLQLVSQLENSEAMIRSRANNTIRADSTDGFSNYTVAESVKAAR